MSGHVNRTGCRADYTRIHGLLTDENGVVLTGRSLHSLTATRKDFEYVTTVCPECVIEEKSVACWVDDHGEDICPVCGMVCSTRQPTSHEDMRFTDTRGSIVPTGPSLAPVPLPATGEKDEGSI